MEVHQTQKYAEYIKKLHWKILPTSWGNLFIRSIPFTGILAKAQRFTKLPPLDDFINILKANKIQKVSFEPDESINQKELTHWFTKLSKHISTIKSSFIPTKTIRIDLTKSDTEILSSFTDAKKRGIKRAEKNGVVVYESKDINAMMQVKSKGAGFLGFITTYGMDALYTCMSPSNATILLARIKNEEPFAGILLIHHENLTYYWIAGATNKAKKLHAPTLLVYKALLVAKNRGSTAFDFLGVFDPRMPNQNKDWIGFTKFKEGFGGKEIYYPVGWL